MKLPTPPSVLRTPFVKRFPGSLPFWTTFLNKSTPRSTAGCDKLRTVSLQAAKYMRATFAGRIYFCPLSSVIHVPPEMGLETRFVSALLVSWRAECASARAWNQYKAAVSGIFFEIATMPCSNFAKLTRLDSMRKSLKSFLTSGCQRSLDDRPESNVIPPLGI